MFIHGNKRKATIITDSEFRRWLANEVNRKPYHNCFFSLSHESMFNASVFGHFSC